MPLRCADRSACHLEEKSINDGLCVLALDTIAFNTDHCFLDDCFDDTSISNNVLVTKVNEHSTPILTLHLYKQNTYKFIN